MGLSSLLRRTAGAGLAGLFIASAAPMATAETPKREDNGALLAEARRTADRVIAEAGNPFAAGIARLQDRLDRQLAENPNPFFDRVLVIDATRFDMEVVMGLRHDEAAEKILKAGGHANPRWEEKLDLMNMLTRRIMTPGGQMAETVTPGVRTLKESRICLVVPAMENTLPSGPFPLPGLSVRTSLDYVNGHEGGHCGGNRLYDPAEIEAYSNHYTGKYLRDVWREEKLTRMFFLHHGREALAEASGLGGMIREDGHGTEVIGSVTLWRRGEAGHGIAHALAPMLEELKGRIDRMGLPAFRAMDGAAAEAFYRDTVLDTGLSTREAMKEFLTFVYGTQEESRAVKARAATHDGARRAMEVIHSRNYGPPPPAKAIPVDAARWDAMRALQNRAHAGGGGITPGTMVRAYAALQGELRARIDEDPFAPERAALLRTVFLREVSGMDFAAANRAYAAPRMAALAAHKVTP